MSLTAGDRLGPYEITAPLGSGGMGACGHAARREACGIGVSSRWGRGPAAIENKLTDLAHSGVREWR